MRRGRDRTKSQSKSTYSIMNVMFVTVLRREVVILSYTLHACSYGMASRIRAGQYDDMIFILIWILRYIMSSFFIAFT